MGDVHLYPFRQKGGFIRGERTVHGHTKSRAGTVLLEVLPAGPHPADTPKELLWVR